MYVRPLILVLVGVVPFLFNTGLQLSGLNSATLTAVCWGLAAFILCLAALDYVRGWHKAQIKEGRPGMQASHLLLAGIAGTWVFLTLALGSAAWIVWNQQGFTIGASPIGVGEAENGPIQWGGFSIEGDLRSKILSLRFPGVNVSKTKALQIKEANIISAIDGTLIPMEIVAVTEAGESKIVPISDVQLIPPGARIELVAKFGPPDPSTPGFVLGMEPKAFLDKWRQFSFNVTDDVRSYRFDFNDSAMMPFFQGKVGPRVMVKPH